MRIFLAGAASLALAAGGALAQPGKGDERDRRSATAASGQAQAQTRSPARSPARAQQDRSTERDRSHASEGERGRSSEQARPHEGQKQRQRNARQDDASVAARNEPREGSDRVARREGRGERKAEARNERSKPNRAIRAAAHASASPARRANRQAFELDRLRRPIAGCPPIFARTNTGCGPRGQLRQLEERLLGHHYSPGLFGLSHYGNGRYAYQDGYLMRLGSGGDVAGYIPLLGGALAIGNRWPGSFESYPLPDYYVDYFDLGEAPSYRYADNVIYRIDPRDAGILSVAALLTGDEFVIGQPMPAGYDVYNVPYPFRDAYRDGPEARYRYSDGYLYRIDPTTELVAAAIELLP